MKRLISRAVAALRRHDQLTTARAWAVAVPLGLVLTFAIRSVPFAAGDGPPLRTSDDHPMDLVWGPSTDLNGAPLAPHWRSQERDPAAASTKPCDDFPEHTQDGQPVVSYGTPPCTSQQAMIKPDRPGGFVNHGVCGFGGESGRVHGHLNWTIATDSGRLSFKDHASSVWGDDDYTFSLAMPSLAGLTEGNAGVLGIELKEGESIDHLGSTWWKAFRRTVDRDSNAARRLISGRRAVVTGLFGLDGEHAFHSELHPVWMLALEADSSVQRNVWALLVRNWGNEGFCSANQHYVDFDQHRVALLLPWIAGADSVAVLAAESELFTNDSSAVSGPELTYVVDQGLAVGFALPAPERWPLVDGVLALSWFSHGQPLQGAPVLAAAAAAAGASLRPLLQLPVWGDAEAQLTKLATRLTPLERARVEQEMTEGPAILSFRARVADSRFRLTIGAAHRRAAFLGARPVPVVRDTFDAAQNEIERLRSQSLCGVFHDSIPLPGLGRCPLH